MTPHLSLDGLDSLVADDGRFRIKGVGPGEHALALVFPRVPLEVLPFGLDGFEPAPFELGTWNAAEDAQTERTFDLRDRFPTRLRATLSARGAPLGGAILLATPAGTSVGRDAWVARADEHGVVELDRLFAGAWRLVVYSPMQRWVWDVPSPASVSTAQAGDLAIDVPVAHGRLSCTDGVSGAPLRNERLSIFVASIDGTQNLDVTTDAAGVLELDLPVGSHEFTHPRSAGRSAVRVEWTAAGPVPNSIAITRQ